MDLQKEREAFQKFCEENFDFERHEQTYFDEQTQCYENDIGEDTESINMAWSAWQAAKAQSDKKIKLLLCDEHLQKCESPTGVFNSQYPDEEPCLICLAKEAKAQAVPDGFVLVKKANRIGNPNVDFSQAPRWAKYWLKDGHSNKYWWSSTRPIKDMDLQAFCWRGDYFAEEAPSFNFAGSWDKSLTSKKAMLEAQELAND